MERTLESVLSPSLNKSYGSTAKRMANPDDERALTGTGHYKVKVAPQFEVDDEDEDDNYDDDDFCSDDDEEDESATMGSTGQSQKFKGATPQLQQMNRVELDKQVQYYQQMLDITNSGGFTQYDLATNKSLYKMSSQQ